MMNKKRGMRSDDIKKVKLICSNTLSSDGTMVAYVVLRNEEEKEKGKIKYKKYSDIFVTNTSTGRTKHITRGKYRDSNPQWSPNNKILYFLSDREKRNQIYGIDISGGEAYKVTNTKKEINGINISPNGKYIAFSSTEKYKKSINEQSDTFIRVRTRAAKSGIKFGVEEKESHNYVLNLKTGKISQLTNSGQFDYGPLWTPDSKHIVYKVIHTADEFDKDRTTYTRIYSISSKKSREVKKDVIFDAFHSISPCGKYIAYIGIENNFKNYTQYRWIYVKEIRSNKMPKCIKRHTEYAIGNYFILTDMRAGQDFALIKWSADGNNIYFQAAEKGEVHLKSINIKTGKVKCIINERGAVGNFDVYDNKIVYYFADIFNPGDLYVYDMQSKKTKRLTSINNKWLNRIDFGSIERVYLKNGNPLQGWIIKPPGFNSRKKYPSIMEIHGGPHLMYGESFFHEFYTLAAKGYIVHFCNPRGSMGYGEKFVNAISMDWGNKDYKDIVRWTDYISRKKYIDTKRMGVTGGSYGGFMTNWIVGHTNRFKAAVTQRSVSNIYNLYALRLNPAMFHFILSIKNIKPTFMDPQYYTKRSPITYFKNVKTPLMIMHSVLDSLSTHHAEEMYYALKYLEIDTELIIFPDEGHELSRSGRTDRRIARINHIVRWFDKYLKK